jgi:hypothetical protein
MSGMNFSKEEVRRYLDERNSHYNHLASTTRQLGDTLGRGTMRMRVGRPSAHVDTFSENIEEAAALSYATTASHQATLGKKVSRVVREREQEKIDAYKLLLLDEIPRPGGAHRD